MPTQENQSAIQVVRDLLADKELWLNLKARALDLQDALDDLNDTIQDIEEKFRLHRLRPGWVPIDAQAALIWSGEKLVYDSGKAWISLRSVSKERRIRAVGFVEPLWEELSRERLIQGKMRRTPSEP